MVTSKALVDHMKDLVRGLNGFYELHARMETSNRTVCAQFDQINEQLRLSASTADTNSTQTAESILACQKLIADLTESTRSLRNSWCNELSDLQASFLEQQQEVTQKIVELQTILANIVRDKAGVRQQKIRNTLYRSGLFVVGHARSGTSILQHALNTSPEIFLFSEANLHQSHDKPGFAAWYRTMHANFNNPPSKSTSCLDPDDPSGNAWDVLQRLRQQYRLVGDKMAFRSRRLGYDFSRCYRFLQDHFTGSHIIGTLRNPRDVLASNEQMFRPNNMIEYLVSYLECLALEIDLACTFDHATILVHECITPDTFACLGNWLGCDLRGAYARWYEPNFPGSSHAPPGGLGDLLELADSYYQRLRRQFDAGPCSHPSMTEIARIRRDLGEDILRLAPIDDAAAR